jgi:hypothetical protein
MNKKSPLALFQRAFLLSASSSFKLHDDRVAFLCARCSALSQETGPALRDAPRSPAAFNLSLHSFPAHLAIPAVLA